MKGWTFASLLRDMRAVFPRGLGLILLLPLLLAAGAAGAETKGAPPSPTPWLEKQVERAKKLAETKFEAGSEEEDRWKSEIKAVIDEIIDWPVLTERSMGVRWAKLSPAQKKEFSSLLRELAEASYQSKLQLAARSSERQEKAKETGGKLKIEWGEEKLAGSTATAQAMVKSGKTKVQLGFELEWKDGRWKVWDVVIDEASTVRTYRTSFTKIMKGEKGYEELIQRMRSRIEKIKSGDADIVSVETLNE